MKIETNKIYLGNSYDLIKDVDNEKVQNKIRNMSNTIV